MRPRAAVRRPRGGVHPGGRRRRLVTAALRLFPFLLLVASSSLEATLAQSGPPPEFEHEVKASFVYTVAKFVDWPEGSFERPGAPLIFEVLGDDSLSQALERAVQGKSVNGHPVEVIRAGDDGGLPACHVLYVGRSEAGRLKEVLDRVRGGAVLTVGEQARFAEDGGVIGLRLEENMIRFEVNVDAAQRAHLSISSKILKIGKVVREHTRATGSP